MMSFRNYRLRDFAVPMGTNWLLNDTAEAKGRQELYTHQSPQALKALREMALVQSVGEIRDASLFLSVLIIGDELFRIAAGKQAARLNG